MKKLLTLIPLFLILLFPAFTETSSAQSENTSASISAGSEFNSANLYTRRGSSSSFGSSSSSTSRQTTSNTSSSSTTSKTDTKSSFGGFGGIMTGLIGGAILGSMLSGMGLGGLAEFAGIIMWGILGLVAFFLIQSFLKKRKEDEEKQKNQGF